MAARQGFTGDPERAPGRRRPRLRGRVPAAGAGTGRDPELRDPIAFDVTDPEFLTAYFEILHRSLERTPGWISGIDPLWMLNHFHFLDNARDGKRPLTFSRYAGPTSHRYPVGFSGDSLITEPRWTSSRISPHRRRTSGMAHGATISAGTCSVSKMTSSPSAGSSSVCSPRSCGCIPVSALSTPRSRGVSGPRLGPW